MLDKINVVITGGCGFIGTNVVDNLMNDATIGNIIVYDKMLDAANTAVLYLASLDGNKIDLIVDDINNISDYTLEQLGNPDIMIHMAAESHVDRSIEDSDAFFKTNVYGTSEVAEWCCANSVRMIHFSTDEVYGSMEIESSYRFIEGLDMPEPRNPYSVTKLFAEHMIHLAEVKHEKEGNAIILRPCNNYGPYQDQTKFVPVCITNIINNVTIPIYGAGDNIREWMYAPDTAEVVNNLIHRICAGDDIPSPMNIGSCEDLSNVEMVNNICNFMDVGPERVIVFVDDPRGNMHDKRYAVDASLLNSVLGDLPSRRNIRTGMDETVKWYTNGDYD